MSLLIIGLIIFLGSHSCRIFAEPWRNHMIDRLGEVKWKGLYTIISLIGLVLIVIGYGQARQTPVVLWQPATYLTHIAILLNLVAFIFLAGSSPNNNAIRLKLKHPMILGVKVWALAHLLANGTLVDLILFGSFLLWAVLDFRSARKRPIHMPEKAVISTKATITVVVTGIVIWAAFIFGLHQYLIGVSPLGSR
ncbi:NnrU family protein [Polynucleobacter sp. AP-Sving-400A-A2]|uniref:NnrU family protein n=1 Tax=Polynucleobacter sp. AP-Sving-400A-A2 TaxID=2081049 RepID=UPI001BFDC274|nr:NnrU family protein [Polynucleobacter sp. AP-Sving-400A-A2]QWE13888.1 NnrU family protein [Polynucleobacter sp. AP-Sving-400A-A2]